jgi:hypothetical protein
LGETREFNFRFDNALKIKSREGRNKRAVVPMGLNKKDTWCPALKRWAIFNSDQITMKRRGIIEKRTSAAVGLKAP